VELGVEALYFGPGQVDAVMEQLRRILGESMAAGGTLSLRAVVRR
jgi:hypothetical protein